MKKCCAILVVLALSTTCTTQSKKNNPQVRNTFASEVQQLKDYFHIPGLAVLIQKGDSVLYEDYLGYAHVEQKNKVAVTTEFPIASITKVFASVALVPF